MSAKIKERLFNDRLFIFIIVMLSLLTIASVFTDHSKQKPVAEFSVTPTSGNAPLNVTFTDQSTGNPLYKWWGFGDGTGSSLNANTINHTYFKAGKYKVYLEPIRKVLQL